MKTLLSQFMTALDAEIALVEKESRDQSYELLSGQLEEKSTGTLYVFVLADTLRLPEDASGILKVDSRDVSAMVVSQESNRVWLLLESLEPLPAYLPSARLVLNETELLKRLREKIEALSVASSLGLAPKVFGKERSLIAFREAPPAVCARLDSEETRSALQQCIGSEVTFLWGPPGTGKTFTIAALVASLTTLDETALVTSHTHVAVEQALWALIEPPTDTRSGDARKPGFLHGSPLIDEGRILKVGKLTSKKIPPSVHLDSHLEERAKQRDANIKTLESEVERETRAQQELKRLLSPWLELRKAEEDHLVATREHNRAQQALDTAVAAMQAARSLMRERERLREKAQRSFFIGRAGRVRKAQQALGIAQQNLPRAEAAAGAAEAKLIRQRAVPAHSHARLMEAQQATEGLRPAEDLEVEVQGVDYRLMELESEIAALRESVDEDAQTLVRNAAALFVTLTKLYMDRDLLKDMTWDTVIVDEASMAMPPLLAYAAARARKRVVVVGDMYQLPPVVHSPPDSAGGLLGRDIFDLREITQAIDRGEEFHSLAKLPVQRRMHPDIAAAAKRLIEP
ncbi:MAG TPA: AAA domain-containing protein, partial [Dehalococcoidia bacterium]|nr:AAA domain-containing protein [Dehalococcoidia bacterium]